jgi:hypothetical protein
MWYNYGPPEIITGEVLFPFILPFSHRTIHRYLKQEISTPLSIRFTSVNWHPEVSMRLLLTTPCTYFSDIFMSCLLEIFAAQIIQRDYAWETCAGANDTGCVGIIDARKFLFPFTLFLIQIVDRTNFTYAFPNAKCTSTYVITSASIEYSR